jgi:hypothetical protein
MAWYVAGSLAGGVVMGLTFGLLVLGFGLVGLAFDLRLFGWRLPTVIRQVDENWIPRYRAWVCAGGFGFQLGLGVVTIVTTSAVYLTWILAGLAGSVWGAIAIGATFGAVRALPMLLIARVDSPGLLRVRLRSLAAAAPVAAGMTTVVVGSLSVVALLALTLGGAT